MKYLLAGLFVLLASASFANDNTYIATAESQVMHRADAFADDIKQISERLTSSNHSGQIAQFKRELNQSATNEPLSVHLQKVSQVLVFLSFSMPQTSLQQWLLQCKERGATPVIRGLINNSFKDTLAAIQRLSQKTGIGLQLDPILFQTFAIKHVPAVVYVKEIADCSANMNCLPAHFDRIYGDVTLDYALEKMAGGA